MLLPNDRFKRFRLSDALIIPATNTFRLLMLYTYDQFEDTMSSDAVIMDTSQNDTGT